MIPIYTDVTAAMRQHLGDTEVVGGQIWTDASGKCDVYLQQAYSELYNGMRQAAAKNIIRTLYGNLPANTSYLSPATFGASNFSEPMEYPLWERSAAGSVAITGALPNSTTPGAPYVSITTATPHGFKTGQMVLVFGIVGLTDDVNDQWSITVTSPTQFNLMGCTATGTWVSGGTATSSSQAWTEVVSLPYIEQFPQTPGATLSRYCWVNGAFRVYPATTVRQVKMIFYLSGKAPTKATLTASLGFDDCLGYLSYRAAALAALDRGFKDKYTMLNTIACGPTQVHSDLGGLYGDMIRGKMRSRQRNPVVVGQYRNARRNAGVLNRF